MGDQGGFLSRAETRHPLARSRGKGNQRQRGISGQDKMRYARRPQEGRESLQILWDPGEGRRRRFQLPKWIVRGSAVKRKPQGRPIAAQEPHQWWSPTSWCRSPTSRFIPL